MISCSPTSSQRRLSLLLPPLLPLLLLRMGIVMTESLSNCNVDEYESAGHCCKLCSAGEFVQKHCSSPHTKGQCVRCPPGSYTEADNGLDSCHKCSSCGEDQEMLAECSATNDRKCQCRTGDFYSDQESFEICQRCAKCPQGVPVLHQCNSTSNTVCSHGPVSNPRNRLYSLLFPLASIIIAVVCLFLLFCGCPHSGKRPSPSWEQVTDC